VPVHVAEHDVPTAPIEIVLPTGCRVHVTGRVDREILADVLAALHSAAALDVQEVRREIITLNGRSYRSAPRDRVRIRTDICGDIRSCNGS